MNTYFYCVKWHDGSGITSDIVQARNAAEAWELISVTDGDIISFNLVEGSA